MFEKRRWQTLTLAVLIVVLAAACTRSSGMSDRARDAWVERVTQQAMSIQEDQVRGERARDAWTERLAAQARAYQQEQAHAERASQAWSDRLTELSRQYANK